MTTATGGRAAAARVMLFSLVLSAGLLPLEASHHVRLAAFPPSPLAQAGAVVVLAGATLALMTPGVLLAWLLGRGRMAAAVVAGSASSAMVALWLVVDVLFQRQTGNRVSYYFKFALQPDALRYAGNPEGMVALFGQQATFLAGYLAVALLLAALVAGFTPLGAAPTRRWPARALLVTWLVVLAAGPLLQRFAADARAFMRLNDGMSMPWNAGFTVADDVLATTERRAAGILRRYHDRLDALPVVPDYVPQARDPLPNVIVLVVDGLRRDVFTPALMPRLTAWSARGARFNAHVSAANGSEWGTFGILYGLTPYAFLPIVKSGMPPTLLSVLWRWGYETHFVTSGADFGWLNIGSYLGPKFFTVHVQPPERPGWENDRDSIAVARDLLARGGAPKFLFIWLTATHWTYSYPEQYAALMPELAVLPAADSVQLRLQRTWTRFYTRAARYVDDLVGEWLEGIDLTRNLVIFTADHGESLFDDGSFGHGAKLSAVETQVPFVIAGPGVPPDTVVDHITGNFDIAATILDLLGAQASAEQTMFGQPLLPADRSRSPYSVVYRPVDESAVQLKTTAGRDTLREMLLVAPEGRFAIRLDPTQPVVSGFGRMDDTGAVTSAEISPADAEAFLRQFEEILSRSARLDGG